jgi:hypothetical protein
MNPVREHDRESIVGGVFGLAEPVDAVQASSILDRLDADDILFMASARSGILLAARLVDPATVWFPSYLCEAAVKPVRREFNIRFYPVDADLEPAREWLEDISAGDLVCVVDYFGWRAPVDLMADARDAGAVILEDASQALLTNGIGEGADFAVMNPRKYVGIPDGGLLLGMRGRTFDNLRPLPPAPDAWWLRAYRTSLLRAVYDGGVPTAGLRTRWFSSYREAETGIPYEPFAMSSVASAMLRSGFDFDAIAARRRANHSVLLDALPSIALFGEPAEGVVPLGFACRFESEKMRNAVRNELSSHGIFAPVHWNLAGTIPDTFAESHDLSRRILMIPGDHRYDRNDMLRVADILTRFGVESSPVTS